MITTIETGRYFHVTGSTPRAIEDSLNVAVEAARAHAEKEGWQGILVTRHEPELYTVTLSSTVPYGIILERDEWRVSSSLRRSRNDEIPAQLLVAPATEHLREHVSSQ